MAAVPFFKVVFAGKIGTTDTWSIGFAFKVVTGGVPTAADCNGIAAAALVLFLTDFWNHTGGGAAELNPTTSLDIARCYYYPGGSTVATVSGATASVPVVGVYTATQIPPQCATVASLYTGNTGRHNRGRVYLPAIAPLLGGGQTSTAVTSNWTTYIAQFLTHMNSATTGAFTYNACIGTQLCPSITRVQIDTIVDTQRRRRDKQVAAGKYSVAV